MDKPISGIHKRYAIAGFRSAQAESDPFRQFDLWFDEAVKAGFAEPGAMALATVDAEGHPSARMVLLKGFDARGFVFYTNYDSRKARALAQDPHVSACFWWDQLERQVRIEGVVERLPAEESDAYFETRPRAAQLAAWVSKQSEVIESRTVLERRLAEVQAEFRDRPVFRPLNWGGYRIRPTVTEFWQGREGRLHDRLRYHLLPDDTWTLERLSP